MQRHCHVPRERPPQQVRLTRILCFSSVGTTNEHLCDAQVQWVVPSLGVHLLRQQSVGLQDRSMHDMRPEPTSPGVLLRTCHCWVHAGTAERMLLSAASITPYATMSMRHVIDIRWLHCPRCPLSKATHLDHDQRVRRLH